MDRRFPIVKFDARKFAGFFGNEAKSLQAQLLSGGACNSNYLVRSQKGTFVCRIHNRGDPRLERAILDQVKELIPVPEYLWVGAGVSVMDYIEGVHFAPTKRLVREAGRIIGRLSKVSFRRSGQLTPDGGVRDLDGWSSYKQGLRALLDLPAVAEHLDGKALGELGATLDRRSEILGSFDRCHNLVHGDFRPDNLLVSNDSIVGVLDWEFCHSGCSYTDIGNLMRHIPQHWKKDLEFGLMAEGVDLAANWMFQASLIDLASHLEFLTSNRSIEFKKTCVERIHRLMKFDAEQGPDDQS